MIESLTGSTLSITQQNATVGKNEAQQKENERCGEVINCRYRGRLYYTLCMYGTFIVIGGFLGQVGPTLLDIQMMNRVKLEQGSWLVTSLYIGYSLGTLLAGFLFNRCKVPRIFICSLLLLMPCVSAIPWSRMFALTIVLYFLSGVIVGIIDVVANTEMIHQWKEKAKMFMFVLHLCFYIGGIFTPLYTGPFLSNRQNHLTRLLLNNSDRNNSNYENTFIYLNITPGHSAESNSPKSYIYIPFSITSAVMFVVLIMYLFNISCICKRKEDPDDILKQLAPNNGRIMFPKILRILCVFSLWVVVALSNAMTASFGAFLSSFCVEYLNWSKLDSSNIMSVHYGSVAFGDIAAIPFSKYFKSPAHTGVQCSLICISFIIVFIAAETKSNVCMWIGASVFGYGRSVVCSLVLTWVNETFVTLTSNLASIFFLGGMITSVLNSLMIAFLMEHFSKMWFCYFFLLECVVMFIFYTIPTFLVHIGREKYLTKAHRSTHLIEKNSNVKLYKDM